MVTLCQDDMVLKNEFENLVNFKFEVEPID